MSVRDRASRIAATLQRFRQDVDCWVASGDPRSGEPYLVPLSFWWDGDNIWIATPRASATGRNLEALESVRLAFGTFRDVVLVHGSVDVTPDAEISAEIGDQFAAKAGFDPRLSEQDYGYFRIRPIRIQAWHEEPELSGRTIMTNGEWRHE